MDYYWKTKEWIEKERVQGIEENTIRINGTIMEPHVSYLRKDLIEMYKLLGEIYNKIYDDEYLLSEIDRINGMLYYTHVEGGIRSDEETKIFYDNYDNLSSRDKELLGHQLEFFQHSYFLLHDPYYKKAPYTSIGVDLPFLLYVVDVELKELKEKGNTTFEKSSHYEEWCNRELTDEEKDRNWGDDFNTEMKERNEWYDNFDLDKEYEKRKNW